jgi:excisionase family DNA binding protein
MANRWMTAPQAAQEVGLAAFSLHRMARRGELRFQRLGRLWLFERREIRRLKRRLGDRKPEQGGQPD